MLEFTEIKKKNLERSHSFAFFCDSDFAFNILNQRLFFVCVVHFSWENMLFSQSAFRESARLKSFRYQNRFYLHAFNVTFMLHIVPECGADACSLFFFHFQYYCFFEANHPPCMRTSLKRALQRTLRCGFQRLRQRKVIQHHSPVFSCHSLEGVT